jgi:putative cell wall-binding protein
VIVKDLNGNVLSRNVDYVVKYSNNVNAGTANVSVVGLGNYTGTINTTYTIKKLDISNMNVDIADDIKAEYTGSQIKPAVKVENLVENKDYSVSYKENINVGTAQIIISGIGSCQGEIVKTFTITKADISNFKATLEYDTVLANKIKNEPAVFIDGLSAEDYDVAYENNIEPGTATVIITGKGNCTGTIIKTFEIEEALDTVVSATTILFGASNELRIAGKNRYETAFATANKVLLAKGLEKFSTVVIAAGNDFPDALSAGYLANKYDAPLLLASDYTMEDLQAYLEEKLVGGGKVYIVGGKAVVSESLEYLLSMMEYDVKRLAGANRYETNLEILKEAGVEREDLLICSGMNFADSLSAYATGKPIMIVGNTLTANQKAYLDTISAERKVYVIGGTGAVSANIDKEIAAYAKLGVERVFGANRFETSAEVAMKFFRATDNMICTYGLDFPDGLVGVSLATTINAPILLVTNANSDAAAAYADAAAAKNIISLGGTALISDATVKKIIG